MSILITSVLFLSLLIFIAYFFKQPAVKGKCGEYAVAWSLKKRLDKKQYTIINNITIPDKFAGTTQIDHIVLSPYGIFVIETKNMKGWIFGDYKSDTWCQQIYRSKNQFQNPFRQNFKHICNLSEILGLPQETFIHVIVFLGDNTIKTRDKMPKTLVSGASELINCITSFRKVFLDKSILENAQIKLQEHALPDNRSTRQKHIEYVKEIIENKPEKPVVCPKCGSLMVLRQARKGSYAGKTFWGCSRYPACKYTINEAQ